MQIRRIKNTNKFLIVGTDGTILFLENDIITKEPLLTSFAYYGFDQNEDGSELLLVGWHGLSAWYKDSSWKIINTGTNSFLEGVTYIGNGLWFSAGWYGRLMVFNSYEGTWSTLQTGRAENIAY